MRVEIIELLRCPAAHEASPLVTVAHSRDGDRLIEGALGCAICGAEYALKDAVVYLAENATELPPTTLGATPDATRTAALLGLSELGMRVALCGAYGMLADQFEQQTGAVCLTVNAASAVRGASSADHMVIGAAPHLPLASGSLRALAVDAEHVALLADAASVVSTGGHVLAPAHARVPAGLRELARDDTEWVALVETSASAPVGLRRALSS